MQDNIRVTRSRIKSNPVLTLQSPLSNFKPTIPDYRQIKMPLTEADIQSLVERRVPIFYGQPDVEEEEVQYFIDACGRIQKNKELQTPDQATVLLEEIKLRLRGKAYKIIRDSYITSLSDLLAIITKKFLPSYTVEHLNSRLNSAKQKPSEDCAEFGCRVQSYALDYEAGVRAKYGADNCLPKPLLSALEQEAFVRGLLNVTIKSQLTMVVGKSTRELIELAEKLEKQLGCNARYGEKLKDSFTTDITCQLCDELGHKAKQCPNNVRQQRPVNNNHAPFVRCRYCKKPGHVLADCASKRASDARKVQYQTIEQPGPSAPRYTFPANKQNQYQPVSYQRTPPARQFVSPTKIKRQPLYQTNSQRNVGHPNAPQNYQNRGINQLTDGFNKMSINYIEHTEDHTIHQGNEEGLVEQQH